MNVLARSWRPSGRRIFLDRDAYGPYLRDDAYACPSADFALSREVEMCSPKRGGASKLREELRRAAGTEVSPKLLIPVTDISICR